MFKPVKFSTIVKSGHFKDVNDSYWLYDGKAIYCSNGITSYIIQFATTIEQLVLWIESNQNIIVDY